MKTESTLLTFPKNEEIRLRGLFKKVPLPARVGGFAKQIEYVRNALKAIKHNDGEPAFNDEKANYVLRMLASGVQGPGAAFETVEIIRSGLRAMRVDTNRKNSQKAKRGKNGKFVKKVV